MKKFLIVICFIIGTLVLAVAGGCGTLGLLTLFNKSGSPEEVFLFIGGALLVGLAFFIPSFRSIKHSFGQQKKLGLFVVIVGALVTLLSGLCTVPVLINGSTTWLALMLGGPFIAAGIFLVWRGRKLVGVTKPDDKPAAPV